MSNNGLDVDDRKVYSLNYFKNLYRQRRDAFQVNPAVNEELRLWKARDNGFDYVELAHGLIPNSVVGKAFTKGKEPYVRSDTFFSEYELHNPDSKILSTTNESYIIGNLESYDKRQYPSWLNEKYAFKTPEGQGFGHSFVIPRKRVFNIVDPDATANDCALIKEMKTHFLTYWTDPVHRRELLHNVENVFGAQNNKLSEKNEAEFEATSPQVKEDYHEMATQFLKLEGEDFVFAFHPYPDYSVGHLHMHVFPRAEALRRVSSKQHDKKTIPFEAVLQVEEEDKPKGKD